MDIWTEGAKEKVGNAPFEILSKLDALVKEHGKDLTHPSVYAKCPVDGDKWTVYFEVHEEEWSGVSEEIVEFIKKNNVEVETFA